MSAIAQLIATDTWPKVPLGDVAHYINGRAFKPAEWASSGLPIIRIQNLNNPTAACNYFAGELAEKHRVRNDDLLVSWSASLDTYIWQRGDAALNQHIFKVVENPERIDRGYLYYALREVMSEIREQTHGATMKHINKPEFEAFEIPLPPIAEQRRMAAKLTEQMASSRRAREASAMRLEAARALPGAWLRQVFNKEALTSWPERALDDVVEEFRYGTSSKSGESGYPTLRIPNVIKNRLDLSDLVNVSVTDDELDRLRLVGGDVLFVRTNGSRANIGRSAIFDPKKIFQEKFDNQNVIYASYIIRARLVRGTILPEFLQYYLQSEVGRSSILERCKTTAGQYNINARSLGSILIPVPRMEMQKNIIQKLDTLMKKSHDIRTHFEFELEDIVKIPLSILRQAFAEPSE